MIKPQGRPAQRIAKRTRQVFIGGGERHRSRQASRDVDAALAAAEQSQDPLVVSYVSMIASL